MRDFLSRYAFFLLIVAFNIGLIVRRLRGSARDRREFLDPDLTPDWSSKKVSRWTVAPRIDGEWRGAPASVSMKGDQRERRLLTATLDVATLGKLKILGKQGGLLVRPLVLGGPPRIELMNPRDQERFLAYASDPSLAERILANTASRSALEGALRRPEDVLTLHGGRLSLTIRRGDPPLSNSVRQLLQAIAAVRAALGA